MNIIEHCDAFILAGGKSSRMGSDKGLLTVDNRELIMQVLTPLQQLFTDVAIVTSNSEYLKFGVPLFQDERCHLGPAGGLLTALRKSRNPWVFLTACDLPFISAELIEEMSNKRTGHLAVVPVHQQSTEPLCAFYHRDLIPVLEKSIDEGQLKMQTIITSMPAYFFHTDERKFDVSKIFMNINTPDDFSKAFKTHGPL